MNNCIVIETALRILILLITFENKMSLERISCYDYMISYLQDYNNLQNNLENHSPFEKEEFLSKPEIIMNSLKYLLSYHLIDVSFEETGIYYKQNKLSKSFINLLKNTYKNRIITQILWIKEKYSNYSDKDLENYICEVLNSKSPTYIQFGLINKEHFEYAK